MRGTEVTGAQSEERQEAEERLRSIFWGSVLLSALIVVHHIYLAGRAGGVLATLHGFLPVVLLWSLAVTVYAFYSVWHVSQRRKRVLATAFTDVGTGVFTLGYLKSCLEHERRRALETGASSAVAYVDLVNLDKVNAEFGHAVGDVVLRALAQVIAENVRGGDIVGRVGGDEFLIVMLETESAEAQRVAEGVRICIEDYRLDLGKRGTIEFIGCRVAVADFPAEGETSQDIITAVREKLA